MLVCLLCSSASTLQVPYGVQGANAFTIEGNSVFVEDAQASLKVTPHTATSPVNDFKQNFEVCNKTETDSTLYVGYVFNKALQSGSVNYWKKPVYGWVEQDYYCQHEFRYVIGQDNDRNPNYAWCYYITDTNGSPEEVIVFEHEFKTGSIANKYMAWDANSLVSGNKWIDVTDSFQDEHTTLSWYGNKHIYPYLKGLEIKGNSCETWEVNYTPNASSVTDKWELWAWAGNTWNCILDNSCTKKIIIDPWWDSSWGARKSILLPDDDIATGDTIRIAVDYSALNVLANLDDIRIVDENNSTELHRLVQGNSGTGDGNLFFRIPYPIYSGQAQSEREETYVMYYKNPGAGAPPAGDAADSTVCGFEDEQTCTWTTDVTTAYTLEVPFGTTSAFYRGVGGQEFIRINRAGSTDYNYTSWFYWISGEFNNLNCLKEHAVAITCNYDIRVDGELFYYAGGAPVSCFTVDANTWYRFETHWNAADGKCSYRVSDIDGVEKCSAQNVAGGGGTPNAYFSAQPAGTSMAILENVFYSGTIKTATLGAEESGNSAPDVNAFAIGGKAFSGVLPLFSYNHDGNLTLLFAVQDPENDRLTVDINYSVNSAHGTGTGIFKDFNLVIGTCLFSDWTASTFCMMDLNIWGFADNNYFLHYTLSDGSAVAAATSSKSFGIDHNAPIILASYPQILTETADNSPGFWIELSDQNVFPKTIAFGFLYNGVEDSNGFADVNSEGFAEINYYYLTGDWDLVSLVVNTVTDTLDNNANTVLETSQFKFLAEVSFETGNFPIITNPADEELIGGFLALFYRGMVQIADNFIGIFLLGLALMLIIFVIIVSSWR